MAVAEAKTAKGQRELANDKEFAQCPTGMMHGLLGLRKEINILKRRRHT